MRTLISWLLMGLAPLVMPPAVRPRSSTKGRRQGRQQDTATPAQTKARDGRGVTQRQQTESQLGGEVGSQQDGEQGGTLPRQLAPAVGERETVVDTDAEMGLSAQHPEQGERLAAGDEQRQPHGQRNQVDQAAPGPPGPPHPPPEQRGHQADGHRQQLRKRSR